MVERMIEEQNQTLVFQILSAKTSRNVVNFSATMMTHMICDIPVSEVYYSKTGECSELIFGQNTRIHESVMQLNLYDNPSRDRNFRD